MNKFYAISGIGLSRGNKTLRIRKFTQRSFMHSSRTFRPDLFSPADLVSLTTNIRFKRGNGDAGASFDVQLPSLLQIFEERGSVIDVKASVYVKGGPDLHADTPKYRKRHREAHIVAGVKTWSS